MTVKDAQLEVGSLRHPILSCLRRSGSRAPTADRKGKSRLNIQQASNPTDQDRSDHREVTFSVNDQPVRLERRQYTGSEIKQAAIEQRVSIESDFVLYLEVGEEREKRVDDGDHIEVRDGLEFSAVAPDDNS